ncbi:MAG: 4Fe-4S binding protein [Bacteroidota bacterium]|nr:4Fe-4S binding protein [Bacteroidota bacterium]MDP4274846.1 4Fe-4S binding protein [Bacteroidota bacterium]
MKAIQTKFTVYSTTGKFWKSLLLTLPMSFILFFFMSGGKPDFSDAGKTTALLVTYVFFTLMFFLMLYTGRTDRYRAIIFILFSIFMSISFTSFMVSARQAVSFNNADFLQCKIPFCHMVIPMTIIPAALTKSIIFPGSIIEGFAAISTMVVIWFGASIVLGRGFCSWGCFYGGWDDGFSRLKKKPLIKHIPSIYRLMPYAVLLLVVISAAISLSPTYCNWLCPFKTVTEYEKVTNTETLIKTIIFLGLFISLVIVLPILTRKRTQCGMFCPVGAFSSMFNKVSAFDVRIDKSKCSECMKCAKVCPVNAISENNIRDGKVSITCTRCGKCVDACSKSAIHYTIKGTAEGRHTSFARNLFLYTSFLFLAVFSSGSYIQALYHIFQWMHLA